MIMASSRIIFRNSGIPLPFISYGGSNMLATLATIGIVLSVNYRAYNRGQIT